MIFDLYDTKYAGFLQSPNFPDDKIITESLRIPIQVVD